MAKRKILSIGAGYRQPTTDLVTWDQDYIVGLPWVSKSHRLKSSASCVWVSACMLVKENNDKEASQIMNKYLSQHEESGLLEWLVLFGGKNSSRKKHATTTTDSLQNHLEQCQAGYQILRVNIPGNLSTHEYLMKSEVKGKYVCVLLDNNECTNHAIGINCDSKPKLIWDCCESQAMFLNMKNLGRCVGEKSTFVRIKFIAKLKKYKVEKYGHTEYS